MDIKETLTDKNGDFYFPAYTATLGPLWAEDDAEFVIYKPGYGYFPEQRVNPPKGISREHIEKFFSQQIGSHGEIEIMVITGGNKTEWKEANITYGVVELPKLKTKEERRLSMPSPFLNSEHKDSWYWQKQKRFISLINGERRGLGVKGQVYQIEQ